MSSIHAVTVYCSSSRDVADVYHDAAHGLGRAIAESGWRLVYGGNYLGLMARVADGARSAGGKVTGVTPQLMVDEGIGDDQCDELLVTTTMRERKAVLEQRGDAFVALPGGLGTFEEFFEILVGRLLGYHDKPIVVLNTNDYYRPLLDMIDHGIAQRFIKPKAHDAFVVAATVAEAVAHLRATSAGEPAQPPRSAGPAEAARETPSVLE